MKKILTILAVLLLTVGCANGEATNEPKLAAHQTYEECNEELLEIESVRETTIPTILTVPSGEIDGLLPVVVFTHGHGGNKDELIILRETLAKNGIASLIFDQPGCGDSKEDFVKDNNMKNILDDMNSVINYVGQIESLDPNNIAVGGYSMGGRAAAIVASTNPEIKGMISWSPAVSKGGEDMYSFTQTDAEGFQDLYDKAKTDGTVTYTSIFGFDQTLSCDWFDAMEEYNPIEYAADIKVPVHIIRPEEDPIVSQSAVETFKEAAVNSPNVEIVGLKGADHGYGLYSNQPELTQKAADMSTEFIVNVFYK